MCDERILLGWAEQYQAEIRKEVEMVRRARLVKARKASQQEPRGSFLGRDSCGVPGDSAGKPWKSQSPPAPLSKGPRPFARAEARCPFPKSYASCKDCQCACSLADTPATLAG
jgi:hypothetical protein